MTDDNEVVDTRKWSLHWFENNSNKDRNTRIKEGCKYYKEKYGIYPKYVYVREDEIIKNEDELKFDFCVVKVKSDKQVLKNIVWFTNEDTLKDEKK